MANCLCGGLFGLGSVDSQWQCESRWIVKDLADGVLGVFWRLTNAVLINHLFFRSKNDPAACFCGGVAVYRAGHCQWKGTMLVFLFLFTFWWAWRYPTKFSKWADGVILGVLSSTAILLLLMMVLVNLSGFDARTAERVNAWVNPFVANNDQMAILHWFRDSVPMIGYGFGDIPWYGYHLTTSHLSGCQGAAATNAKWLYDYLGDGSGGVSGQVWCWWWCILRGWYWLSVSRWRSPVSRWNHGCYRVVIFAGVGDFAVGGDYGVSGTCHHFGEFREFYRSRGDVAVLSYGNWMAPIVLCSGLALFQPKLILDGNKP